jgi:phosphotransferase system enzyme I (PtsI)
VKSEIDNQESDRLVGVGISPGVAYGIACRIEPQHPSFYPIRISVDEIDTELARFKKAIDESRRQYLVDKKKFEAAVGKEHSFIIDAHLSILQDRQFLKEIEKRVRKKLESPERALKHVSEKLLTVYHSLDDPFFRERSSDFEEVVDRIVANLMELGLSQVQETPQKLILAAPEIGLGVLAQYPLDKVKGIVLTHAGRTSHVAIVARSYGIPVVSGIQNIQERIETGDLLIVDGTRGIVEIGVTAEGAESVGLEAVDEVAELERLAPDQGPCITTDGHRILLYANTEMSGEVKPALEMGAEGIGLFRTEFIYLRQRSGLLNDEEHTELYRRLAEEVGTRTAVVRTFDISEGGKDESDFGAGEERASLGLRGIRHSLKYPDLFRAQIRAINRAREYGSLRIVLPMVTSVDEVVQSLALIREVEQESLTSGRSLAPVSVGVLLEVPAAVLTLEAIASKVDFLAVGTNDLIQYTLAAGRMNDEVAYLYNPLHPAVLGSLRRIAEIAEKLAVEVTVCGEMAANPVYAMVLVGLGFKHLSMTPRAIRGVKDRLLGTSMRNLKSKVERLLELAGQEEIEDFVNTGFGGCESQAQAGKNAPMG